MSVNTLIINDQISINDKVTFITDNINEIILSDRRAVLQMIYNSPIRNKLKEKGGGTQVKIDDLSNDMINNLYHLIMRKLNEQKVQLNCL
jgi:hypothetical protein